MPQVVFGRIVLLHQYLVFTPVPASGPVLVRPYEEKWEFGPLGTEGVLDWSFEKPSTVEPIVVVGKASDPGSLRQRRLALPYFGDAKIVESEVRRQMRLVVAPELGPSLSDVGPLGEPSAPPLIVFGDGMILREVKGQHRACVEFGQLPLQSGGRLRTPRRPLEPRAPASPNALEGERQEFEEFRVEQWSSAKLESNPIGTI